MKRQVLSSFNFRLSGRAPLYSPFRAHPRLCVSASTNRRSLVLPLLLLTSCLLPAPCFPASSRALARTARPGQFTVAAVKESGERGGALSPTTEDPARFSAAGNEAFGACMRLWNAHRWDEARAAMLAFSAANPADPWRGESDLHVACCHKFRGEHAEAEAILARLAEEQRGNPVGRKALVRLSRVYFDTRRYAAARAVLHELLSRDPTENEKTYALNWLPHINRAEQFARAARECGPKAFGLAAFLLTTERTEDTEEPSAAKSAELHENKSAENRENPWGKNIPSLPAVSFAQVADALPWAAAEGGSNGVSVAEMRPLLSASGLGIATRRLTYGEATALATPSSPVILCIPAPPEPKFKRSTLNARHPTPNAAPSPLGHYTVLVKADASIAWLVDPDNGLVQKDTRALRDDWLRGAERGLACLLSNTPASPRPRASALENTDADDAFTGGCCGHETNNDDTGIADDDEDPCGKRSRGMPAHAVHSLNLNYMLTDTPLWHDAPAGPPLEITLTYNNRESYNAKYPVDGVQFYPFGCRWSAPYDSSYALDPATNALVRLPTGRELYFNIQSDGSYLPRDTRAVGQYDFQPHTNGTYRLDIDHGRLRYLYRAADPDNLLNQTLYRIEDSFGNAIAVNRAQDTGRFSGVVSEVTGFSLVYHYDDAQGTVTGVALHDPSGVPTGKSASFTYTADVSPDLLSITDMGGQTTTLEYGTQTYVLPGSQTATSSHHVTAMQWPNGGVWTFDLHQKQYLDTLYTEPLELAVTDPSGRETVYNDYAFAPYIGLVGKRDRNGAALLWLTEKSGYDGPALGRYATLANERHDSLYYRRGEVTGYSRHAILSARREVTFERALLASSTASAGLGTDKNNTLGTDYAARRDTTFAYADLPSGGRLVTASNKVYAANSSTPAEAWTETSELDANEDPVRLTARDGSSLLFTRTNRLVTAIQLVTVHSSLFTVSTQTLWQAGYNALGQTLWHTADEGLSNTLRYAYDDAHRLTSVSSSAGGVHAATLLTFGYEDGELQPSTVTDADGNPTFIERDALERPTLIEYPDGTADRYAYNCCQPSVHIDRHGVTNHFTYDGNKRLESSLAPFDARTSTALAFSYLGEGELSTLGIASVTNTLPVPQSQFATRSFLHAVTNGITRLQSRRDAIGRTRESFTHTFDGLPASRTDAVGNLTTNIWDASHTRVVQRSTFDVRRSAFSTTSNRHDLTRGLLTNTVRRVTSTPPSSLLLTTCYSYDHRHRPTSTEVTLSGLPGQTAPLSYTVTRAYGPRGFVTNRTLTVGGTVIPESYTHHPFLPALAAVSNPHASVTYTHSDSGRLLTKATPATAEYHAYDGFQRPASTALSNTVIHSSLIAVNYAWDVDRLASVAVSTAHGSRLTAYSYNLQSMVTGATTYSNAVGSAGVPPAYLERFDYKATGSMTARTFTPYTNALPAPNAILTANRADELTRHVRNGAVTITGTADPAATVNYFHTGSTTPRPAERDASGRWVTPNVPMFHMSNGLVRIQFRVEQEGQAPSFRLSEFSVNKVTTAIGNNANGSITNLPGGMGVPPMILAYDSEGNLACVSNAVSGAVSLYWYDQHGRRVAKSESGLLTLYIWDGMDIIATAHADGTIREYYTRGIGIAGDVGSLVAETRFENNVAVSTTYLHSNWRGDVVMATDTAGNVVGEYAYTTFGEQLSATGTYTPRFTFSSKERDASGLVYHGFRYYSPVLCRWISEDPIRESGSINLYQFCWNNPINFIDPYGLDSEADANFVRRWTMMGSAVGAVVGGGLGGSGGAAAGAITGPGVIATTMAGTALGAAKGAVVGGAVGGGLAAGVNAAANWWNGRKSGDSCSRFEKMPQGDNTAKNKQFSDAMRELGIKPDHPAWRRIHDAVHGKNYNYRQIVETGRAILKGGGQ